MTESTQTLEARAEIIRSSVEVIHSITYPLQVWEPLLSGGDELPMGLRIRALPIVVCCLFDIAEAPRKYLIPHIDKSQAWPGFLSHNLSQLSLECRYAAKALITLTYADQIFLRLTRNRMVHGYLNGSTKPYQKLKVADKFGIGVVCVTDTWAADTLGERRSNPHRILNFERLEEILHRFDKPFRQYVEETEGHYFLDTNSLKRALEADHPIFIEQKN